MSSGTHTRKSPRMLKNTEAWGNIMLEFKPEFKSKSNTKSNRKSNKKANINWNITAEALEDYKIPDLRLRKAIWETFPVDLKAIPSKDETDRYAIVWNMKKVKEWREHAETRDEYMDYLDFQAIRLLHALKNHPAQYRLEPARNSDEIAVIAMVHSARSKSPKRLPVLRRLIDIRNEFPGVVVWKQVPGRRGESTYALTIMNTFLKSVKPAEANRILDDLMDALRASDYWLVMRPVDDEFVRLEMRHD